MRGILGQGSFWAGCGLLLLALLPILLGTLWVPAKAGEMFAAIPNLAPQWQHPFGTQAEGRDMLALMARAIPASLMIGLVGGGAALLLGGALGLIAGYFGGLTDAVVRIVSDVGLTIPPLAILILVGAALPSISVSLMGLVIAATIWMSTARVVRSQTLTLRERGYINVARLSGIGHAGIISAEILPNLLPFLGACFVNGVTVSILSSIGLEMLGLGPGQSATLGSIVYEAITFAAMWKGLWWWWVPPVAVMVLIFLGLFLLSLAFDALVDPRRVRT